MDFFSSSHKIGKNAYDNAFKKGYSKNVYVLYFKEGFN